MTFTDCNDITLMLWLHSLGLYMVIGKVCFPIQDVENVHISHHTAATEHKQFIACRRIDCEQLCSSINQQLIARHFGHEDLRQLLTKVLYAADEGGQGVPCSKDFDWAPSVSKVF